MFIELVKDALVEYSYDAELAGLSYTFDTQGDGILLTVDGYNDKLHVLAKVVVEKMKSLQVDEERFRLIMDQVRRACCALVHKCCADPFRTHHSSSAPSRTTASTSRTTTPSSTRAS